jgi:hypothetical protein
LLATSVVKLEGNGGKATQSPGGLLCSEIASVISDGSVKGLEEKGGRPVLAQAAMNAVRKWRW